MSETLDKAGSTRRHLLEVTAKEVLENGFRATGIDQILRKAGVTKGALYYHFKNKDDLGLAMVDEIYRDGLVGEWERMLHASEDPVQGLIAMLRSRRNSCTEESIRCGCPVNNLTQEMAPVHEGFRLRLEAVLTDWRRTIADALERGKESGHVRQNADTARAAVFITSLIQGAIGLAKNAQSKELLQSALSTMELFLETLRPGRHLR